MNGHAQNGPGHAQNGPGHAQNGPGQRSPPKLATPSDDIVKDAEKIGDKAVVFSLNNQVGGLVRALRVFQELGVNVKHIESRKSKRPTKDGDQYEIYIDIDCDDEEKMVELMHLLRHEVDGRTLEEFERCKAAKVTPGANTGVARTGSLRGRKTLLSQPSLDSGQFSFFFLSSFSLLLSSSFSLLLSSFFLSFSFFSLSLSFVFLYFSKWRVDPNRLFTLLTP